MAALTRDQYFDAALDVIAREGVGALTIGALCQRLDVTIGSFYHHFKSSQAFLQAFFAWWEAEHAFRMVDEARLEPDPVARLALLKKLAAGLPHGAEASIRTWSTSHPDAAAAQSRVDEARIQVVLDTLRQLGLPPGRARTLAVMAVGVLVGTQELGQAEDPALMRKVFDELELWLTGTASG
ncbi:MAG TPA: TetR/AcrR family transcriptional regulator [Acidimicrobiia bacterium]|jgi:AcrR family transcriptional regulator|nr:TetR/AcrR family transcriptional regulator [Acidimicrobiia bacterium]